MSLIDTQPGNHLLNIAATCSRTQALGPGIRASVWVQGCPFRCPGCIAPDWIDIVPARQITPEMLAAELMVDPQVNGLTFSGGEPMLQARGLAETARIARQFRELNIICFTGYRYEMLRRLPVNSGVYELLQEVDTLIDGPYIQSLNDGQGLRGSTNQRIIHLTERLISSNLEGQQRSLHIEINHNETFFVGIPPNGIQLDMEKISRKAVERMVKDERA